MVRISEGIRLLPVIIIGVFLNYMLIKNPETVTVIDEIITVFTGLAFAIYVIWCVFEDRKRFAETKSKWSFISTVAGLICLLSFIATSYFFQQ